jgi:hypothetical protein
MARKPNDDGKGDGRTERAYHTANYDKPQRKRLKVWRYVEENDRDRAYKGVGCCRNHRGKQSNP